MFKKAVSLLSLIAFVSQTIVVGGFAALTPPPPIPCIPPIFPIQLELLRISNLPETRYVTQQIATILSSPEMLSLPQLFFRA
jgi:hypothetical protein